MIYDVLNAAIPTLPPPDAPCHNGICDQADCANCQRIAKALQLLATTWWIVSIDYISTDGDVKSRAYGPYLAAEAHEVLRSLEKEGNCVGGEALPLGLKE